MEEDGQVSAQTSSNEDTHKPVKIFESPQMQVFDDFLSPDDYESVYEYCCTCDYEHINTKGKVSRVWRPRDGFPLRGLRSAFFFAEEKEGEKEDWEYPTGTGLDRFSENIAGIAHEAEDLIGSETTNWKKFSTSTWIYPVGTGLSLHNDGVKYSGAYVYFLNPTWNVHWGGLLMVLADSTSETVTSYKKQVGAYNFVRKKWSDDADENSLLWDPGLAQCILPKRNRLVFLSPSALHWVTSVAPAAGDNVRRSLAGFFLKDE